MKTAVIIDIVAVLVPVGFAAFGAHRGLFRTLAKLVIIIVAFVGAGMIAAAFSGPLADLVTPMIQTQVEEQMQTIIATRDSPNISLGELKEFQETFNFRNFDFSQISGALEQFGLEGGLQNSLVKRIQEKLQNEKNSLSESISDAFSSALREMVASILYGVLYIVSFIALNFLLNLLVKSLNVFRHIPGLHILDTVGGGLLGLSEGLVILFLFIWVAQHIGVSFETGTLAQTQILHALATGVPPHMPSLLELE